MVQYIINQCQSFSPSNYNIDISIIHGKESYSSQLEYYEKIKQLNSIKEYSIFANFKGTINGKEISIIACEGKVFDKYLENLELKKSDISSSGIIINDNSNITQFKQGNILPVIVNEKEYNIPIIKVTNNSPWDAVQTLDISKIRNTNNATLILSIDMVKSINFEQKGISISSSIGMKINAEKPKEIEKEILKIIKSKNTIVTNYQRINENNQRIIFIVHAFIYGILIAVSVICIANIYNTILANMNLRNREFAILQSIGMEQKQLRKMFFYESVLYTIKALIIGTIVGFITTFIIYLVLNDSTLVYNFPIYHILFASVFIFAIIIMITNINYKKVSNSSSVNRVIKQQGT